MEAGDAPQSDAERCKPDRRSAWGACQRSPSGRQKRGRKAARCPESSRRSWYEACALAAGPRAPARSWRWPAGFPSDPS